MMSRDITEKPEKGHKTKMNRRQHAAKPRGIVGKRTLDRMNGGVHAELSKWGLSFLTLDGDENILEIGCGGGANVANLLERCPEGHVTGLDYSDVSVKTSRKVNAEAVSSGRCAILEGNVSAMPFDDGTFDLATAFETIYFWPGIADSFAEVFRVLKDGGKFFICNETDGDSPEGYQWAEEIEGMTLYRENEIVDYLKQAGFSDVSVERSPERHWICFLACKPPNC